jgi:hypothetical protein
MDKKEEPKPKPNLEFDVGKFFRILTQQAALEKPKTISEKSKKMFRDEWLTILFGERFTGWFFGIKRILTILFVPLLFLVVLGWLGFCAYFLWWGAFHRAEFGLSDNVLVAMITSTTATVIGLFHYAARWMFAVNPTEGAEPHTQTITTETTVTDSTEK